MKEVLLDNIKEHLKRFMPAITTIILLLVFNIPKYPFVADSLRPYVSIICVYFWLINRTEMFGISSVYIIGTLEDIISSTPFGINIFTMLFAYVITNAIYKFVINKPFIIVWYGFGFVAFCTILVKWFITSIYYSQFIPFIPIIFSLITTIIFYPIISLINAYIQEHLIEDDV